MSAEQFRLVVAAAMSDGSLDESERQMLRRAAFTFDVDEIAAEAILSEVDANHSNVTLPTVSDDPKERQKLFRALLDVVTADGQLDDHELKFMVRMAPAFGLQPIEAEDMVIALSQGGPTGKS